VLRAAARLERAGIRTVSVICQGFLPQATVISEMLGGHMSLASYPGVILLDDEGALEAKVRGNVLPEVIAGLKGKMPAMQVASPRAWDQPCFSGDLDEVESFYLEKGWSDGLPIIPPTPGRVDRFLAATLRDGDERGAQLLPSGQYTTAASVAVNGIMAGCRAEYMPLLMAIVDALGAPEFGIEHAGSTPGWEPFLVVNGPVIEQLGFNHGAGVLRMGRQANTSVGRFVRLFMRNVAGLRIRATNDASEPYSDKGTFGSCAFYPVVAEAEDIVRQLGWPTFAQDRGFAASDSVVTVQSAEMLSPPLYSAGSADENLRILSEIFGSACAHWTYLGLKAGMIFPLLMLNPSIATVIKGEGYTKETIRSQLYELSNIEVEKVNRWGRAVTGAPWTASDFVADGRAPSIYSGGPLVPVFPWREKIGIVVTGDPMRNQSRAVLNNHLQGPPVSRVVAAG
jgi:hypothetical protein